MMVATLLLGGLGVALLGSVKVALARRLAIDEARVGGLVSLFGFVLIPVIFATGFLTDQCIDHAVKDGADLGYFMSCVHDACAADTEARHQAALDCFRGYCRMISTAQVLDLVGQTRG